MSDDGAVWSPTPDRRERANATEFLRWLADREDLRFDGYEQLWQWSVQDLGAFWEAIWRFYEVRSPTPHETALPEAVIPGARWFEGARLNYAEAVLARADALEASVVHVGEDGVVSELTIGELRGQVGALAATLHELGVRSGDRVAAYLPNVPEAIVGLLATASLGAVWSVCAPDFATSSVADRFSQIEPKVLIAVDGYRFNGRRHDRWETITELHARLPSLRATIISRRLDPGRSLPDIPGVLDFSQACAPAREPEFATLEFAHPLWILFSSGTTGLPKGIVQSHGGILLEHLKSLGLCMDLKPDDRYLFYSSTSWMAWNYLVGGLLHGTTVVLYDGSPSHGDPGALWRVAATTGATVLAMGSAYAAACQRAEVSLNQLALGGLRTVIPTGSPLGPAGWQWLSEQLGPEVRIDSICGGTDVCTAFFGGSELLPVWAGEASCRWLGVGAHAFDPDGHEVIGDVGEFVLTVPMPSMPTGLWGDEDGQRYRSTYVDTYPGVWRQGDWIAISPRGSVRILGRSDATLNRGGVRLGSAEIYAALDALEEISDSLVVGVEQPDGGYWMPIFVVSDADPDQLRDRISLTIRAALSPRHVPDEVIKVPTIPRTLTGKKLEVPVKRILQGMEPDQAAAAGSVDHPEALAFFARFASGRGLGSGQTRS
jgi:acetoacetyl-CoA synthetase